MDSKLFSFKLPNILYSWLKEKSRKEFMTISGVLIQLIKEAKEKENNKQE